ncbi:TlpA family protein disulfide reductase [Pedobacter mendelii]|uniref:Thioredoxin domain-containing protein n=1 Tax=Pedobacter mendelii TaxID=1908240 RepID=A0ABQ2BNS5_9SPHI|nr:TlpA disulfide reductase family protein [Pedobacter mendelii]GGI29087.1 hypothetical protein GCM10008119_35880 [Pedobacter mendelii]
MIKKITVFAVMGLLCLNFPVKAQHKLLNISPVKVGAPVPDLLWNTPMSFYKSGKFVNETLEQYKGRVIVFDFWASWCGSCIEGFPKLRQLQDSLFDGLQIVLVNKASTRDTRENIKEVFAKNDLQLGDLPTVVQDSLLAKLFLTTSLPSYVVISGDKYLEGITQHTMFHPEDIKTLVLERKRLLDLRRKINEKRGGQ